MKKRERVLLVSLSACMAMVFISLTVHRQSEQSLTANSSNKPLGNHRHHHAHSIGEIELPESLKAEVNALLRPDGKDYSTIKTDNGLMIDLRGRAAAVPVAVLSEDGELTIIDITQPLP